MSNVNLVLIIPQESVIATSLGLEGLAWRLSPGSGRHFRGRAIFADLSISPPTPWDASSAPRPRYLR